MSRAKSDVFVSSFGVRDMTLLSFPLHFKQTSEKKTPSIFHMAVLGSQFQVEVQKASKSLVTSSTTVQ